MVGREIESTFKEIRPSGRKQASNSVNIIFVHGLDARRATTRRKSFVEWLCELSKTTNGRIWMFGFDAGELLTKGNESFTLLADDLDKNVQPLRGAGEFVFIGHDLAGWVVEETLARYNAAKIAWNTAGVIFLGLPPVRNKGDWDDFSEGFLRWYYNTTRRRCNLEFSVLERVAAKFKSLKGTFYEPIVYNVALSLPATDNSLSKAFRRPKWLRGFSPDPRSRSQSSISRRPTALSDSSNSVNPVSDDLEADGGLDDQQIYLLSFNSSDNKHKEVVSFILRAMARKKPEPRFEDSIDHWGDPSSDSRRTSASIQNLYSFHSLEASLQGTMESSAAARPWNEASFAGDVSSLDQFAHRGPVGSQWDSRLVRRRIEDEEAQQNISTKRGEADDFGQVKDTRTTWEDQIGFSTDHKNTPANDARALIRLAALYQQSGELKKSKPIYVAAKTVIETKISGDHEGIDYIRCQLAILNLLEGNLSKAEEALAELETKYLSAYGDHPRTWEVMRWLAISFDMRGRYQEALLKIQQIPIPKEMAYSEPVTHTIAVALLTQSTLALVTAHMGNYQSAIEYSALALSRAEAFCTPSGRADMMIPSGLDEYEIPAGIGRILSAIKLDRANILVTAELFAEARDINDQAMKGMEGYYGNEYVATLECWSLKVLLLAMESQFDEAEHQCQTTLKAMRRDIGKEHPSTLRTLGILVFIYRSQAKWAEAIQNATYLVKRNRTSHDIGPKHPQTIDSIAQLADLHLACGLLVQALLEQIIIVGLSEENLGKTHPITLNYRSDLAKIYCNLGNWSQAQEILFEVFVEQVRQVKQFAKYLRDSVSAELQPVNLLVIRDLCKIFRATRSSGEDKHYVPLSLVSTIHRLGVLERDRQDGNLEIARDLLEQAAQYRETRLGRDHAETLSSQLDLAIADRKLSFYQNSSEGLENLLEEFNRIVDVRKERLDSDHPDTLSARYERSLTRFQSGILPEAVDEQEEILRSHIRLLGEDHPNTIKSFSDLSNAHHSVGNLEIAIKLQIDALKGQLALYPIPILNGGAKETFEAVLKELSLVAKDPAKIAQANIKNLDLSESEVPLSPETSCHPQIISSMACLAPMYAELKNFPLAVLVQEAVVSQHRLTSFENTNSITTLESINALAALYQAQSNVPRAIALYKEVLAKAPAHSTLFFTSQAFLGSLYFSQDDFASAEAVQTEAYEELRMMAESEEKIASPEALVIAGFNLALTKWELHKRDDAMKLMDGAREVAESGLGWGHERTREVLDTLREWESEDLKGGW